MSDYLATSPRLEGEAPTVEGRLADMFERGGDLTFEEYKLSAEDKARIVAALRYQANGLWALDCVERESGRKVTITVRATA